MENREVEITFVIKRALKNKFKDKKNKRKTLKDVEELLLSLSLKGDEADRKELLHLLNANKHYTKFINKLIKLQ
jgi:hypothetical protein